MIEVLILRLEAPLMSFGAPVVDYLGVIQDFPAKSMLVGLFGNALGYRREQADELRRLQGRLRYAARRDRLGERIVDYQTVDLGQPSLQPARSGWTTRGRIMQRAGASSNGTHQRWRHYHADAVYTVAATLDEPAEPTHEELAEALRRPKRPLFLGRKPCLPAAPLLVRQVQAESLKEALESEPRHPRSDADEALTAWWPPGEGGGPEEGLEMIVHDDRDWLNQVHVGERRMFQGLVRPPEARHG